CGHACHRDLPLVRLRVWTGRLYQQSDPFASFSRMSPRPYASVRGSTSSAQTKQRVLDAAADLVEEDAFHTATMDDLARRAGVSPATVFTRFGSKLGVLEALSLRCAGGPEMRAIREAQAIEDPLAAVDALLEAGCDLWEKEGYIMVQLKAIVVLEPDASAILD